MPIYPKEAAARLGIHKSTLLRWIKLGRVPDVRRDRNGWRVFTDKDIEVIARYARSEAPPPPPVQAKVSREPTLFNRLKTKGTKKESGHQ
jgi:excisionase family DNA binding protein